MPAGRRALALALVALALAGCASSPPPPAPAPGPGPVVVTSLSDAESLSNATFMNERHQHDYWNGQAEIVVADLAREEHLLTITDEGVAIPFRPDSGHVVPQGTDRVTVTLSWEPEPTSRFGATELWVRTPRDHDAKKVAAIESGKPTVIPTTLADADVPHQQLSAWRFELRLMPGLAPSMVQFDGTVRLLVAAHRGLDIPVFPPHPDRWNGRDAIDLFDDAAPPSAWDGTPPENYRCYTGSCPQVHRAVDGTIAPYDTRVVEVRLQQGEPTTGALSIRYHGSDSWNWTRLEPTRSEGATRVYEIPVSGLMGDGPYAAQSLWEFVPVVETPQKDGYHAGGYRLWARALR